MAIIRKERRTLSPFENFTQKATNMLTIWETIMRNLSGTDVANILKVNKSLRAALAQCFETNTRLRHEMDAAATTCAINRNRWKTVVRAKFMDTGLKEGEFIRKMCNIDNLCFYTTIIDYYDNRPEHKSINILWLNHQTNTANLLQISRPIKARIGQSLSVFPTLHEKRHLVRGSLLEINSSGAKIVSAPPIQQGPRETRRYVLSVEEMDGRPVCARYKLYEEEVSDGGDDTTSKISMTLLSKDGIPVEDILLHMSKRYGPIKHSASNEQVMECRNSC